MIRKTYTPERVMKRVCAVWISNQLKDHETRVMWGTEKGQVQGDALKLKKGYKYCGQANGTAAIKSNGGNTNL